MLLSFSGHGLPVGGVSSLLSFYELKMYATSPTHNLERQDIFVWYK